MKWELKIKLEENSSRKFNGSIGFNKYEYASYYIKVRIQLLYAK